jgi:hypothetical protein
LSAQWDGQAETGTPAERRATLEALRERLLERNYINNLLTAIDREAAGIGLQSSVSGLQSEDEPKTEDRRP